MSSSDLDAGKDLPQMLRCSWQNTLPMLETVPFEPGSDIPSQAVAYRQSHPDLDMFDSSPLSPEEALHEAAKLNAETAISIAERVAAETQSAPTKARHGNAESWEPADRSNPVPQHPQPAEGTVAGPAPTDARAAIEEQLLSGAGYSPIRQAASEAWPAQNETFNANAQFSSALESGRPAVMPEGMKGPPKEEARALSLLGRKQTTRPRQRGGHFKSGPRPNQVRQCQYVRLVNVASRIPALDQEALYLLQYLHNKTDQVFELRAADSFGSWRAFMSWIVLVGTCTCAGWKRQRG